ncbi:hypothetical protein ACR79T_15670 [Sphingobacterium spiritivorum]|uniref:hypothetical protein n=1 Tax=Sphingobacterium spiritivorum TaxID=258 RepID=UPI003DA3110D
MFEISVGGKSLPFSLNYHASGIKVSQRETEVGLGWSLSGIYTISRTVMGGPDEKVLSGASGVYFHTPKTGQEIINYAFTPIPTANQGEILTRRNYLRYLAEGTDDNHSDIYSYTTRSNGGKFLVQNMNEYFTIPKAPVKISRGAIRYNEQNAYPFTLVDAEGLTYLFDETSYALNDQFLTGMTNSVFTNSWYISKISDNQSSESASFVYERNIVKEYSDYEEIKIGYEFTGTDIAEIPYNHKMPSGYVEQHNKLLTAINHTNGKVLFEYMDITPSVNQYLNISYTEPKKFIKKISVYNIRNELVREIHLNYDNTTRRIKLASVLSKDLSTGLEGSKHSFAYSLDPLPEFNSKSVDYWGYFNGVINNSLIPNSELTAEDIPAKIPNKPLYKTSAGSADRTVVPDRVQAEILKRIIYPTGGYTDFQYESNMYMGKTVSIRNNHISESAYGQGVNVKSEVVKTFLYNESNAVAEGEKVIFTAVFNPPTPIYTDRAPYPQTVTLKDLTTGNQLAQKWHNSDPSKQLTVQQEVNLIKGHEYELRIVVYGISTPLTNYFSSVASGTLEWKSKSAVIVEKPGAGLRIREVNSYDPGNVLVTKEAYAYGSDRNGIGEALFDESILFKNYRDQHYFTFYELGNIVLVPMRADWWTRTYFGLNGYSNISANGASIIYKDVWKTQHNVSEQKQIVSKFNFDLNPTKSFDSYAYLNSQNYGANSYLLNDPKLIKKTDYLAINTQLLPLQKEATKYTNEFMFYSTPMVYEDRYFEFNAALTKGTHFSGTPYEDFKLLGSQFSTSFRKPILKETMIYNYNTDYSLRDSIMQKQEYEYNANYADQPSRIRSYTSDIVESRIDYLYADDIADFSAVGVPLSLEEQTGTAGWKRQGLHLSTIPIRVSAYKGNELINSSFNTAKTFGTNIFPYRMVEQRGGEIVKQLTVSVYDTFGNPGEIKKNQSAYTVYLWGYNGQYPVAEIVNAHYNDVVSAIGGQSVVDALNSGTITADYIRQKMDILRSNLPGSQVTSYTYKPLVGMTSKTDAKGQTEYYQYDGLQRLQHILDQFQQLRQSYHYHYRP